MSARTEHPAVVHRRRERDGVPINDRRLRRLVETGDVLRIVAGSYVLRSEWEALTSIDRHYLRVLEATARSRGPVIVSHFAAAAVWGIDVLGPWPSTVDVRIDRASGGRSSGVFRRRALGTDGIEATPWMNHWLTSPAQTAVDIAALSPFTRGVVVLDRALWARRPGGPLTTEAAVDLVRERTPFARAPTKLQRAVDFATPLSDSVGETRSRVLIHALGFPAPELQRRFALPSGRIAFTDFFFAECDAVGEFDGVGKYLDPVLLRGRTPEQALIEEKDRGDELARTVRRVVRWRSPALDDSRLLYDILTGSGVPTTRARPRTGFRWA